MRPAHHRHSSALAGLFLSLTTFSWAQGIITSVAGSDYIFGDDGVPATQAQLAGPVGIATDSRGNYYIAEPFLNMVLKVEPGGVLSVLAGNGLKRLAGMGGLARAASVGEPRAVAIDREGNVYIASEFVHAILKVDPSGTVTALASGFGFAGDGGPANRAQLSHPTCIAVDGQGNVYFCHVGEGSQHRIRRIDTGGIITTVAGGSQIGSSGDGGAATSATLSFPRGIAVDAQGNLYIAESNRVRRVSNGMITTFAGGGENATANGIPAIQASLNGPFGLTFDSVGNLLIAEEFGHRIRRVTPAGIISTVAGRGMNDFAGDGDVALNASFSSPSGVAVDSAGVLIADRDNYRVRRVLPTGIVQTVAGRGAFFGDQGAAVTARLIGPVGIAVNSAGALYIADTESRRIRRVSPGGEITTLIGTGRTTFSPDNSPAASASIQGAVAVAVDATNNVYFNDYSRIRRVSPTGVLSTFAGNGNANFSGDGGSALNAGLTASGMAFDRAGNLYVVDSFNARIRRITPAGIITTIGGSGQRGFSGDNGPARNAAIDPTQGIAVDAAGNVYFSEYQNQRVRRIGIDGVITTFAGNGRGGSSGDGGPANAANVGAPTGLAFDSAGNLFIASAGCNCVRRVSPSAIITRYAGNRHGFGGDGGSAVNAAFNFLNGLAIDSRDNLFAADFGNQRVRLIQAGVSPSIVLSQKGLTYRAVAGAPAPAPQTLAVVNAGQGPLNFGVFIRTLSGGSNWLSATPVTGTATGGGAGVPVTVSVNPAGLAPGDYYGQVEVRAAMAANSPQFVTVVLNVLPGGGNAGVGAAPAGLLFTAAPGGPNPAVQAISLTNLSPRAVTFGASVSFGDGRPWFTAQPLSGSIGPGQSTALRVTPELANFTAGVYNANITVAFSDGTTSQIQLLLVVSPAGGPAASKNRLVEGCTPTRLVPLVTSLGAGFRATTSWPTPLELRIVDNCGQPMTAGEVNASFSNGESPVALAGLRDGRWSGTWQSRNPAAPQVTITFDARLESPALTAFVQVSGGIDLNANPPPDVAAGGMLHAASFRLAAPLALGNLVSIFGSALSQGDASASSLPLPAQLAGTTAVLAGRPLPLVFASLTQINAVVPYDLPIDSTHQLVIRRGNTISVPEPIRLLSTQPGAFTRNQRGSGPAIVVAAYPDGTQAEAGPENPLKAGDVIVVYCTGLGDVEPRAVAGVAAPITPLSSTVEKVTVRIAGIEAEVFFAGLTPLFTGLYQVNARVPQGVPPGDEVPLIIEQSGRESVPVTLVVR